MLFTTSAISAKEIYLTFTAVAFVSESRSATLDKLGCEARLSDLDNFSISLCENSISPSF